MKIAMIMLAAGNSRRFGANKLLYEIDGIPMYRHVLEQLDDTKKKIENIYSEYSDITEDNNNDNNSDIVQLNNLYRNNITAKIICNIIVITQYDAIAEAVKTKEIQVLYNPHPEDGISSSVKIGLNASLDADAVLFTVSDQPWLTSETICELIHVFLNTSKGIACVSCQGKMGNPCIFDRKYYNELLSLEGDKGGKKVIMKHLDDTQIYEIEAGRELEDIDYYESIAVCGGDNNPGALQIAPTVMDNVTFGDAVMQEEIFGPVLPVLTYDSLDEAIEKVNSMAHPLALYIFTSDKEAAEKVTSHCGFGGGCVNDTIIHLATSEMGFGGFGESGMGSYHGKDGFHTFSHYKSIVDKKTWLDLPMRYQPYRKIYEKLLRKFLK